MISNWITGSVAVDPQGNPLRVYHGTHRTFKEFEIPTSFGKVRYSTDGGFEMSLGGKSGIYFTASPEAASTFAIQKRMGKCLPNVRPAFLRILYPYIIDADGKPWTGRIADDYKMGLRHFRYDGIIVRNVIDCGSNDKIVSDVYVVKHPEQIKTAIGFKL